MFCCHGDGAIAGEAPRDVMLIRYAIQGNVPIDARLVPTTDGSRIGYIFIPSFFDETLPKQIENALNEFGPLDGLILDVRMNGGGSSSVAYPILEFFVNGRLGDFVSRNDSRALEIDPNEVQNSQTVPLIVMVSQDTVSFGEIFAGALRDSGRAKIVGETSLGNVEVLHGYDFDDGSQIWLAAETFHSAFSDANWEDTGWSCLMSRRLQNGIPSILKPIHPLRQPSTSWDIKVSIIFP
jgi:C-terminal processing protease CtpA/Prc